MMVISRELRGRLRTFLKEKDNDLDNFEVEKGKLFYLLKYDKSDIPKDKLNEKSSTKALNKNDPPKKRDEKKIVKDPKSKSIKKIVPNNKYPPKDN